MNPGLLKYLKRLRPAIDVHGKWVRPGNPKTAQKSMMLGVLDETQIVYHRGWRNWRRVWDQIIVPRIDDACLWTVVRNPWDKAVSAFFFLQERGDIGPQWTFGEYCVEKLAAYGTGVDRHFRPQDRTFMYAGKPIAEMYVARFERLQEDWATITERLGISAALPHQNPSKHEHYTSYYDKYTREIIRGLYRTEIDALGYEFDQ